MPDGGSSGLWPEIEHGVGRIALRRLAIDGGVGSVDLGLQPGDPLLQVLDRIAVQSGIAQLGGSGGEVWFKLDAGTAAGLARINGTRARPEAVARRLACCAELACRLVRPPLDSIPIA